MVTSICHFLSDTLPIHDLLEALNYLALTSIKLHNMGVRISISKFDGHSSIGPLLDPRQCSLVNLFMTSTVHTFWFYKHASHESYGYDKGLGNNQGESIKWLFWRWRSTDFRFSTKFLIWPWKYQFSIIIIETCVQKALVNDQISKRKGGPER